MDKSTYYKILDDLESMRKQLTCVNPRNPGLRKMSSDFIKITEKVIQYRDVLVVSKKDLKGGV